MSNLYTVLPHTFINSQNYNEPFFTPLMCEQKRASKQWDRFFSPHLMLPPANLISEKKIEEQWIKYIYQLHKSLSNTQCTSGKKVVVKERYTPYRSDGMLLSYLSNLHPHGGAWCLGWDCPPPPTTCPAPLLGQQDRSRLPKGPPTAPGPQGGAGPHCTLAVSKG